MDQSLTELLPRMLGSMGVVMGVMWLAARVISKRGAFGATSVVKTKGKSKTGKLLTTKRSTSPAQLQVLSRQGLGRKATVAVVRAGDKTMILGITEHNVSLLGELEEKVEAIALDSAVTEIELDTPDSQWTGNSADAQVASSQAWTGLLSQIRERTVRRT